MRSREAHRNGFRAVAFAGAAGMLSLLVSASGLHAQAPSPWSLELRSGITKPSGDLQGMYDSGPALGFALDRRLGAAALVGGFAGVAVLPGTRDLPEMRLFQYRVDVGYELLRRGSATMRADAGVGAVTLATSEANVRRARVFCVAGAGVHCPSVGTMRRFRGTYPLSSLGLSLGWRVATGKDVFLRLEGLALFIDQEDTDSFTELCDEQRCFSSGYHAIGPSASFPFVLGLRIAL